MKKNKRTNPEHDAVEVEEETSTTVPEASDTQDSTPTSTVEQSDNTNDTDAVDELEAMALQRDEFKAALQRERADFVNFKKRTEREKSEMKQSITGDTVKRFLPILDDFERALNSVPNDTEENGWVTGFTMIHKKFKDVLAQMGVEVVDPLGEPFDPEQHEAIGSEPSDEYESDTVTDVLQKGYMLDGRIIRVAMVKVAD
jgi:molecular chaperone GrpE